MSDRTRLNANRNILEAHPPVFRQIVRKRNMIFYTDYLIPKRFGGYTFCFVILIRPKYKDDIGLLRHEETHVKQFWRTFGLMPLLYLFKTYRLKYEVEAYKVQLKFYDVDRTELFAGFLATKYQLDITQDEAIKLLQGRE